MEVDLIAALFAGFCCSGVESFVVDTEGGKGKF